MPGLTWSGAQPSIGWGGSTAWDEPRNWGLNGIPPNDYYPTNANLLIAAFAGPAGVVPGPLTGPCQTTDLRIYAGAGQVQFGAQFDATAGTQVYVESIPGFQGECEFTGGGIGVFTVGFGGGNFGASGAAFGPATIDTVLAQNLNRGDFGGSLFTAACNSIDLTHRANGIEMAFVGAIGGTSNIRAGKFGELATGGTGDGSEVTLLGANGFSGFLRVETNTGARKTAATKLNLKNDAAAGAAGNVIYVKGGTLTQNGYAIPWSAYTLVLENTVRITPPFQPLAYFLPDEKPTTGGNIKGSGANWRIRCGLDIQELCGTVADSFDGYTDGGASVPVNDNIVVEAGTLFTRGEFPCHIYGNLSFGVGGSVRF